MSVTVNVSQKVATETKPRRPGNYILALLVIGQLMIVLDFSIVQIALPTIRTQLGISLTNSQWLVSAYGITFAGLLLLSGRISDIYGRRRLFIIGLILFALSSLAAGLAPSELVLIGARAIQGIGGAMVSATALALITVLFPEGSERNRALSAIAAVGAAGFAIGVILGGILTATLGWRWIFFVNVPIGIVAAILANRSIRESKNPKAVRHLDLPGAIAVTAGLSLLVYALTVGANTSLFSAQTFELLGASIAVLAGFLVVEYRSKYPLIPLGFLRRGTVFTSNAIGLLQFASFSGLVFLLTIYLQQLRGLSPIDAALVFVPIAIVTFVASGFISARLVRRFGLKRVLISGTVLRLIGFLLVAELTLGTPILTVLIPWMFVVAVGGIANTAIFIAALTGAKRGEEGLASGLINTSLQVGAPIGLAIAVTIASVVTSDLTAQVGTLAANMTGFDYGFISAAVIAGISLVFAALLRSPKPSTVTAQQAPASVQAPIATTGGTATVVTPTSMQITRILAAVDGSENARRASETSIKLAKDYRAELIFLNVVTMPNVLAPIPTTSRAGGGSTVLHEFYDYAEKNAIEYVNSLVNEAKNLGVSSARGEVVRAVSSPASAIVEKANGEKVDVIVIGTRGLGRPQRFFLGSVSAGVVADANTQVLVVR